MLFLAKRSPHRKTKAERSNAFGFPVQVLVKSISLRISKTSGVISKQLRASHIFYVNVQLVFIEVGY